MKLLVVDDNERFTRSLYSLFSRLYTVHIALHAHAALQKIQQHHYDAILLDLGLPDANGSQVYQHIRRLDSQVPVIVLSGQTDIPLKISLLRNGVSDYLTKPIHAEELLARIQLHMRKPRLKTTARRLICHDLIVDTANHSASRDERPIFLRAKEYALLECLMLNLNQTVPKDLLMQYAWENEEVSLNTLHVHMSYLRSKINIAGQLPYIMTMHGKGYRLANRHIQDKKGAYA